MEESPESVQEDKLVREVQWSRGNKALHRVHVSTPGKQGCFWFNRFPAGIPSLKSYRDQHYYPLLPTKNSPFPVPAPLGDRRLYLLKLTQLVTPPALLSLVSCGLSCSSDLRAGVAVGLTFPHAICHVLIHGRVIRWITGSTSLPMNTANIIPGDEAGLCFSPCL